LTHAADAAEETVHVAEAELVVPGGRRFISWFVLRDVTWVRVEQIPGATSERQDAGPGTVWERTVTVRVPRGSEMMRVEVAPRKAPRQDPLSHLAGGARGAPTATTRRYYVVERAGRLRPKTGER
jgi:hypothetical protein